MIYCKNNCGYDAGTHTMCINMPGLVYKDDCNYTWCVCKVFLLLIFKGNEYCGNKIFILKILIMWDLYQLIQWAMYCNIFKKRWKKNRSREHHQGRPTLYISSLPTLAKCASGQHRTQQWAAWADVEGLRGRKGRLAADSHENARGRGVKESKCRVIAWVSIKRIHA